MKYRKTKKNLFLWMIVFCWIPYALCNDNEDKREIIIYPVAQGKWKEVSSYWAVPIPLRHKAKLLAKIKRIPSYKTVELFSGRKIHLVGIDLPDPFVRPPEFEERLRQRLEDLILGKWVHIEPENYLDLAKGDDFQGYIWVPNNLTANEILLKEGKALLLLERPGLKRRDALVSASKFAMKRKLGWFGLEGCTKEMPKPWPFIKGAVLPLYYEDPNISYKPKLKYIKNAQAESVSFLFPAFIERPESVEIDRFSKRTVRDLRLKKTIIQAKEMGLNVMLLPIVLIKHPGEDDWRGSIRPSNLSLWFDNYLRFILHYTDISQRYGVQILSAGSELCSLEKHETYWRWILLNLRGRFSGLITYSFNWDHIDAAKFQDLLDFIGMTGYFSLTEKDDPSLSELIESWEKIKKDIGKIAKKYKRPIVFTELGYPSQDGANKDPWNYYMNPDKIDLQEQADCLKAFTKVFSEPSFLMGVYFFDWFEKGGPEDPSYSPLGKPALDIIKKWYRNCPKIWKL